MGTTTTAGMKSSHAFRHLLMLRLSSFPLNLIASAVPLKHHCRVIYCLKMSNLYVHFCHLAAVQELCHLMINDSLLWSSLNYSLGNRRSIKTRECKTSQFKNKRGK